MMMHEDSYLIFWDIFFASFCWDGEITIGAGLASYPVDKVCKRRWTKISCFRQEEFSSETLKAEYIGHLVPEVVKLEFDCSKEVKRDWGLTLKEV